MGDGPALLQTVLTNPADDAPRLIYADWLEEHGDPDRADFIRLQIRRPADCPTQLPPGRCGCRACDRAARRVRGLILSRLDGWVGPVWDHLDGFDVKRGFLRWVEMDPTPFMALAHAQFARQPVEAVDLAGRQPEATGPGSMAYWYRAGVRDPETPHDVPAELMAEMTGDPSATLSVHDTPAEARAALSRACVAWGRRRANLPALR